MDEDQPPSTLTEAATLIESAMAGVLVVTCPKCEGRGDLPKALYVPCPQCEGAGEIVTTTEEAA